MKDNGLHPEEISREDEVQIKARAMLRQIGAQTLAAIGARDPYVTDGYDYDNDGNDGDMFDMRLTMVVLRRQKQLQITLDLRDTYTVTFLHIPSARAKEGSKPRIIKRLENIYHCQLSKICYWITHDEKIRKGKMI